MIKNCNLMLHCGANRATLDEVRAVVTPNGTDTHLLLPHESFIERVRKTMKTEGVEIVQEEYALAKQGQRLFGVMALKQEGFPENEDFAHVLGLRNSHDKSCPAGLCIGASVFVCDNMSFNSEINISRRHTGNMYVELAGHIFNAVSQLAAKFQLQAKRFEAYKHKELTDGKVNDLVIRMFDNGVYGVTDIPRVLKEVRTPSHPEFDGRTAWSLFNGVTEVLKNRDSKGNYRPNLFELPKATRVLHDIIDVECEVAALN